jgi:type II secretory pathway pseudopilin PulG
MRKRTRSSEQGVALIIVLSLVAVMAMLAMVFFSSTAAESQSSQSQSSAQSAQQLASSAAQIVMTQIQAASNRTQSGAANANNAVAWTSQPGLLRTFTPSGPSTVYKLYSDTDMVTGNFSETNFAPPSTWKSSPAIYCDLNAPVTRAGNSTSLAYPIADPSVAAVSLTSNLTSNGTTAVPGFAMNGTAPGYSGSNPSPTNNPLPMPVRWLYVLKNGQLTTPSSVDAGGNVTFTSSDPQPSTTNPVVGRVAFWADDETCKVNINTAGYAKNDANYWTYWDAPNLPTKNEFEKLNVQPWTNEFLRYPGHPATTGLNLVFEGVSLTSNQIASLTPRYNDGGTLGGTNMANSANATALAIKTARLFPTVDEMFYNPARGAAATGISSEILEARRFFLTATSRAPETTLLDTPKTTLWPVWQDAAKRTATDKLIAFCSTIGNGTSEQPFYFVRGNATHTDELTAITQNSKLYSYLQTITSRNLPGVGTTSFQTKYASQPVSRDQILTSFFDAIRLTNLYDQSPGATRYTDANSGWVNSSTGPNNTFSLGRNPTLEEVNIVFTGGTASVNATLSNPPTVSKFPICYMYYSLNIPAAGSVFPGQNFRMEVSGLNQFTVTANGTQQIFPFNTWENSIVQTGGNVGFGGRIRPNINSMSRGIGGTTLTTKIDGVATDNGNKPFTSNPLDTVPYTTANQTFSFGGGNLTIRLYAPATSTTPYQTFDVNIPSATVLTPRWTGIVSMTDPGSGYKNTTQYYWNNTDRWPSNGGYQDRAIDMANDTVLGVATSTGDMRSLAIRQTFAVSDFKENVLYGPTTRSASTVDPAMTSLTPTTTPRVGRLVKSFSSYNSYQAFPQVPSGVFVDTDFAGAGDWDNGIGGLRDGSYSPKADEGVRTVNLSGSGGAVAGDSDYFYAGGSLTGLGGFFSPNRQVPSAAIYGNLPTGTWRTLLFRPARAWHPGGTGHFGATTPPDMYLLDFFHMPVVEPYAISEPFSTAGKINMNAQVIPFSGYITRETGLRAVLASTRLTAYNSAVNATGLTTPVGGMCNSAAASPPDVQTRFPLNLDETIKGFRERYDGTDAAGRRVFVSPAEICGLDLVPDTSGANAALFGYGSVTKANLANFWAKNLTTGDNSRERPYAHLLPRLTTRSNSYTAHVTTQALAPGPGVVGWQEGRGKVLSEWRGAYTIERYVDPNDERFTKPPPDTNPKYLFNKDSNGFLSGTQPVGPYYKFRVLGTRRFNP